MSEENKIIVVDENGKEAEMEIVLTFEVDDKKFVLFKNFEDDDVYAYTYDEAGNLEAVENEEDLDICSEVLETFQNEDLIDG